MKTNEVFNCARLLPFPPGAAWKTQLPRQRAAERWASCFAAASATKCSSWLPPRLALGPTRPTSITPNSDTLPKGRTVSAFIHPEELLKKKKRNAPDCYCLRCNWACKNIRARIAWHLTKRERREEERKRRLTKHRTSNIKTRERRSEEYNKRT